MTIEPLSNALKELRPGSEPPGRRAGRIAAMMKVFGRTLGCIALLVFAHAAAGDATSRPPSCTVTIHPGTELEPALSRLPQDVHRPIVCLGRGDFHLRRFVALERDGVTLRGAGPDTVLRLEQGAASPVVVIGDFRREVPRRATSDVTIEGLAIVGGGSGGSEFEAEHPYLTNSSIVVRRGRNVIIRNVDVSSCRSACIVTERDTEGVVIEKSHVTRSVWDGISLNRTSRARVIGNVIRDNTASGITVEHLENSVIRDNLLTENKTHGIYLSDSYGNTIADNHFTGNVLSGVFLTCAVRTRAPVRCWDRSMSGDNRFERNQFVANRSGFTVAADDAANCRDSTYRPNVSRGDVFAKNPNEEPSWALYGRCLRYAAPRSAIGSRPSSPGRQ